MQRGLGSCGWQWAELPLSVSLSLTHSLSLCLSPTQVEFPPDLCSRVTFVNFTVTRSSLQSQCLNEVLKAERPDVDEKRSDLLKLQGMSTWLAQRPEARWKPS